MRRMRMRLLVFLTLAAATARANFREFKDLPPEPKVDYAIRQTAEQILKDFPKLTATRRSIPPRWSSFSTWAKCSIRRRRKTTTCRAR